MEERKTVQLKKEEYNAREYIKKSLGKGKISRIRIEYTPVGEKIVISTSKPGLIIGRGGDKIRELTQVLKKRFKLDNPHIEIEEIMIPEFDSQSMADNIAIELEKFGPVRFKIIAYKTLEKIMRAGAFGAEIRMNGKLPSSRAKQWRFGQGYLKKTGDPAKLVDKAQARAETKPGTVGIKVSILSPKVKLKDKIIVNEELLKKLNENKNAYENPVEKMLKKTKNKKNFQEKNSLGFSTSQEKINSVENKKSEITDEKIENKVEEEGA